MRPRLLVFGHIHFGYGVEERVYDLVGKVYEGIERETAGGKGGGGGRPAGNISNGGLGICCSEEVERRGRGEGGRRM